VLQVAGVGLDADPGVGAALAPPKRGTFLKIDWQQITTVILCGQVL